MNILKTNIKFDFKKAIIVSVAATVLFVLYFIFSSLHIGAIFGLALAGLGCFSFNTKKPVWEWILNSLWAICLIYLTLFVSMAVVDANIMGRFGVSGAVLNVFCVVIVCSLMFSFTAKWKTSVSVSCLLLVLLVTLNGFVYQFRGKELLPTDFFSAGTALNVIKQYKPKVEPKMLQGWFTFLFVFLSQFAIPTLPKLSKLKPRVISACLTVVLCVCLWTGTNNMVIKLWDIEGTEQGFFVNFFIGIRNSFIEKPEGYNAKEIEDVGKQYAKKATETKGAKSDSKPNIIVIMNESFADLNIFENELNTNIPVTPFLDSVTENAVKGHSLVSVYGGNTANSEMEFLTGHSMAFLPEGSVPYQQYINEELYSLAWVLKSRGYKTMATHPFPSDGWAREKVYPYLGFSESTFLDDYSRKNLMRYYVSDMEMYKYIINKVKNQPQDEPYFLFGITMQNHGGYTYKGKKFKKTVELSGYKKEYPLAEQYLSLINYSDIALEYLIKEVDKLEEDTIVLFFGDHLPRVEDKFYQELIGENKNELEIQKLKHTVPFLIWANYDIEEKEIELTSLNYLSSLLLETAGVELDPFNQYLKDLNEKIPTLNAFGYYSEENGKFISIDEAEGKEKELLNQYAGLQYNNLKDVKNRSKTLFGEFISHSKAEK